jgi:hypothetical protein
MNIQKYNPLSGEFDYYNYEVFYNNLGTVIENTIGNPSTLTPNTGDRFIPLNPSVGVWLGQYPNIAIWDGTQWVYYNPVLNDRVIITTGINAGNVYNFDGVNWVLQVTTSNDWIVGGNVLTSLGSLGSLTNQPVNFITNNVERVRILETGQVLIATTDNSNLPNAKLYTRGASYFQNTINDGTTSTVTLRTDYGSNTTSGFSNFSSSSSNVNNFTNNTNRFAILNTSTITGLNGFINSIDNNSPNLTINGATTISFNGFYNFGEVLNTGEIVINRNVFYDQSFLSGTIAGVTINKAESFFYSPSANGNIGYFIFNDVIANTPNNTQLGLVVGYRISASFDNIVAGEKYAFLSESTALSRHKGDFEFLNAIKLRGVSNFVSIRANSGTSPYTLTVPTDGGTNGFVLQTDGTGQTSWADPNVNNIPEWIAPPLTSTSVGLQGQKAQDALYVYFCYADNQWNRVSKDLSIW